MLSEYEKQDLEAAQFDRLIAMVDVLGTHLTIFMTLISAYLVVAYMVGAKLTRPQVTLVSALYFCATLFELLLVIAITRGAIHMMSFLSEIDKTIGQTVILNIGGHYLGLIVLIGALVLPLWFMWSIRRNDKLKNS